jgi:hypothetical protein
MRASTSEEARRSSATGDSYRLRHEQSERPVVLHRHGLTVYREGSGGGRTETVTRAEVNRFTR